MHTHTVRSRLTQVYSSTHASRLTPPAHPPLAADWLVERRVVSSSWPKSLRSVQAKVAAALAEERPSVPGIAAILPAGIDQTKLNYTDCAKVLQLLKDGGLCEEKSFLGAYTNPHAARWADVVKRYESGSIFLVDLAQHLVHNCSYELPAIKKEMVRAQKELHELERRQAEYNRLADGARHRFQEGCEKRQMVPCERDDIGATMRRSLSQLLPLYQKVGRLCQAPAVVEAIEFYRSFVTHCLDKARAVESEAPAASDAAAAATAAKGKGGKKEGKAKKEDKEAPPVMPTDEAMTACLAQLQRVQRLTIPDADAGTSADGAASGAGKEIEIDWGDMGGGGDEGGGGAAAVEVDWGGDDDGGAAPAAPAIEVDWGAEMDMSGGGGGGGGGGEIEVDWGAEIDGDGAGAATGGYDLDLDMDFAIEVEGGGEGVSADELGLSAILEDAEQRNLLQSELGELQGFLKQRVAEGPAEGLPRELQTEEAQLAAWAAAVGEAHEVLEAPHTQHLLLLQCSSKYVDRQVAALRQQLDHADKMTGLAEELRARQAELQVVISEAQPRYDAVSVAVRQGKKDFEGALSKEFKGRKVNLMGEINDV